MQPVALYSMIANKLCQRGRHIFIVSFLFVILEIKSTLATRGDKKTPAIKNMCFKAKLGKTHVAVSGVHGKSNLVKNEKDFQTIAH